MNCKVLWIAGLVLAAMTGHVHAAAVFSSNAVVTTVNRSATFDSLTSNDLDLSSYSEDSMFVTVGDVSFQGFTAFTPGDNRTTGFHYGRAGNNSFVTIKGTDGVVFKAIDFLLGDGYVSASVTNVRWETYLNGVLTGSGTESSVARGTVVGWTDANGMDELRVAADAFNSQPGFGGFQAIAIDDLRVQFGSPAAVPEPGSLALWGLGTLGAMFARRKRQQMKLAA